MSSTGSLLAADAPKPTPALLRTSIQAKDLDAAAYAEWADGAEQPLATKEGPRGVMWTGERHSTWNGIRFGDSKQPGPRHLRIGFKTPVAAGTVLVRGGGKLTVLKSGAAYPGDLADDSLWLPARRILADRTVADEVGDDEYALWVLPPGTTTRALRFSHEPRLTDTTYSGWLGGVYVLEARVANLAPRAAVAASSGNQHAHKLINESHDRTWKTWENDYAVRNAVVSEDAPETITLVWPEPVPVRGLAALWAGFGAATVQVFNGPADMHPAEAPAGAWSTVRAFSGLENHYPHALGINWLDFGRTVQTRAVRLLITQVTTPRHPHLEKSTREGKRVWLGELMTLQPLENTGLVTALPAAAPDEAPPVGSIPIRFTLPETGYVTLVIEDASGMRARNLVSETPFPAGPNVVWWDGMDDLQRDSEAARHGVYHLPERFVAPGQYRVRGLFRQGLELRYEFPVYTAGDPAWSTPDHTGGWIANHTPPNTVLFVPPDRHPGGEPLVYIGCFVTEGPDGLVWIDLEGRKKGGKKWLGGNWTAAQFLARDAGASADTNVIAIAAAAWSTEGDGSRPADTQGEVRLTLLTAGADQSLLKHVFNLPDEDAKSKGDNRYGRQLGGLAAFNGLVVFSLPQLDQLVWVDRARRQVAAKTALPRPQGLAFDARGRLLAVSGNQVHRYQISAEAGTVTLPAPEIVVRSKLDEPRQLALDAAGNLYVSEWGASHQVKVFDASGRFLRAIGDPGRPTAGRYNPRHMNHPHGLTIDSRQRLWVAEADFQPKRVSVWSLDGRLLRAFYGPSEYGGGGELDGADKSRFYYHGMEFKLDWDKGASDLATVLFRAGEAGAVCPDGHHVNGTPQSALYFRGRRYFANCYNSNPTGGASTTMLWIERDGIAAPVAAMGRAKDWSIFSEDRFKPRWPAGLDLRGDYWRNPAFFVWSDANDDGQVQPEEVAFQKGANGGITVMPDLSFLVARIEDRVVRFAPGRFTAKGTPVYDLKGGETLVTGAQGPTSSGGDQALLHENGWLILTVAPKPFAPQSLGGVFQGRPAWSYPSPWPGLHASHESPPHSFPGQVIGSTRLLGGFVTPPGSDAGPLWCVNGNQGNLYLFTADGLFVATLFHDVRQGQPWSMPIAKRNLLLNDLSLHDENFWPSIAQTADGRVYLVDGARSSLVRLDGLPSIRRLPETTVQVTAADLQKAQAAFIDREARRQREQGRGVFDMPRRAAAFTVDGKLEDWAGADWLDIDKSGVAAYFNSDSKPHDVTASLAIAGGRLFVAIRADDPNLLQNSGEMPLAPFKTGGALDLMLGTDAVADDRRSKAVPGDLRLLVTRLKDQPWALLYRPVAPGGGGERVPFASPWRTIYFDRVENVSEHVALATTVEKDNRGKVVSAVYEFSVPLKVLNWNPEAGRVYRGDLGVLRGSDGQTRQRVYWNNKATGITADVPSEAELTPRLWGRFHLE